MTRTPLSACLAMLVLLGPTSAWGNEVLPGVNPDIMTQQPLNEPDRDTEFEPDYDDEDENDPLEPANRLMFTFNEAVGRFLLRPLARTYVQITPEPVRIGVGNFLSNLFYPRTVVNDFLQGKFRQGAQDTGRFLVNTTIGFGGVFDPATRMGWRANNEDFGQTLGVWGASTGPYLVLPLVGPGNVRDTLGRVADYPSNPLTYVNDAEIEFAIGAIGAVSVTANLLQLDRIMAESFDPYAFQREAYGTFREASIRR